MAPLSGTCEGCSWNEKEDEAHNADCVILTLPLPGASSARDVRAELHLRSISVFCRGELFFQDTFAEEGWLSLDESYWEFVEGDTPSLTYFLVKNANFQREPLYCLFDSELRFDGPPSEESEGGEPDVEATGGVAAKPVAPASQQLAEVLDTAQPAPVHNPTELAAASLGACCDTSHGAPPAVALCAGAAGGDGGALSRGAEEEDGFDRIADSRSRDATSLPMADDAAESVAGGAGDSKDEERSHLSQEEATTGVQTRTDSCSHGTCERLAALATAAAWLVGLRQVKAPFRVCLLLEDGHQNVRCGGATAEVPGQRIAEHLQRQQQAAALPVGAEALEILGGGHSASETAVSSEAAGSLTSVVVELCAFGALHSRLSVAHVADEEDEGSRRTSLADDLPFAVVCVPAASVALWYYACALPLRRLAERGALLMAYGSPDGRAAEAVEAVLCGLGCNLALPFASLPRRYRRSVGVSSIAASGTGAGGESGQEKMLCCVRGAGDGSFAPGCRKGGQGLPVDFAHHCFLDIRRTWLSAGLEFRPAYSEHGTSSAPALAARAARFAWRAAGASKEDAAAAAGVSAAEVALDELEKAAATGRVTGHRIARVQAAVAWTSREATSAGASESRAAAVGALMGLREGVYVWDVGRPLERHGIEIADIVGTTLANEGMWKCFSEDSRKRKIADLTRAGGLRRPGECTIALCQALLGVNRPKGGSRQVAAFSVLKKVAQILIVEALSPNMLDVGSSEVSSFCSSVLEAMNLARLYKLLEDREAQAE